MIELLLALGLQTWPQFRGPDGQGHAQVKDVPLAWTDASPNIKWKTAIQGLGWSSPVVAAGRVWLTTATEDGKSLRALAIDAETGGVALNVEVFRRGAPGRIHRKNSHASPTPILDGDRVYVHFGTYGTACLTKEGKPVWKQALPYDHVHGPGGSPQLHGEFLIINCDGADSPYVVALDRKSGAVRWKTSREPSSGKRFAFGTPLSIEVKNAAQVVSPGAGGVTSYDPATGRPVWHVRYEGGYSIVPRPVYGHGLVFLSTGFDRPVLLAIRADGRGDVTDTHVAWRLATGAPLSPSPLLVGDELYLVSDQGVAGSLDARTGKVHWQERLGGNFSASPLYAAERIYFQSEEGVTTVVKPGKTFARLARNDVKARTFASPAPIEGALFLRTETHLLRIEAER